ncbi:peptidylprolyl isomerase [Geotalea toluenoxydans]|uniref:peptidylprolyl isomerase n=1 Tax=Geotalea toluenoxydans TaxID=421624 RepID=UPI0006CFDDA9|nr:peptidylprolyl isomerase [Geotalea toluenoxydans]
MQVRSYLFALVAGMLLAGTVHAEEVNPVVGKVGDFVLRQADLERVIANLTPEAQQKFQGEQEQASLVNQILLTKALAAKARKEGFERKPEVKEQLSYIIDQFLGQEYLRKVVTANVEVPDAELKKYYQEHEKDFVVPERVKVRHIYFAAEKDATAEVKAQARAKAEKIAAQLKKGEDFAKLAGESSEDAESSANGGDLGYLTPGKTNSEEFEKAAFSLKAGEVSPVVETPFGYHIIKVDERQEKRTATFEETKDYISSTLKAQLEEKKAREFLDAVAKEGGLQVFPGKKAEEKSGK